MQLQRLYQLPNCSLLVQGLSDASLGNSQCLTIVTRVECGFPGLQPALRGGKDFLVQLTAVVSAYAQGMISGLPRPQSAISRELVQLRSLARDRHQLISTENGGQVVLELNSLQLFDLLDAIDQLVADPLALPDLQVSFAPLPRRHVPPLVPLPQRAAAPAMGLAGLAIAAAAFFALPIPEIKPPKENLPQTEQTAETPNNNPPATTTPPSDSPEIRETASLEAAVRASRAAIATAWDNNPQYEPTRTEEYRVSATATGQIVGYRTEDSQANIQQTPLASLLKPLPAGDRQPLADLRVVFEPSPNGGSLEVSPWDGY
ncbi:DUF4335 domain-containing protein [Synechococcus elongatus]|uniref:DUF4335 domain-containing protein n=1 Tax=Synechococcus elongatus PCC 11802 TaxID=2283154 RepID=A0AAT9JYF1_SYNEL|nr:DUF4335 domain-containing protein [Synechococcus elongatus]QFZ91607.1 DUF4335 domain-containing protein [Synechococcus elongatus PCC 11802]